MAASVDVCQKAYREISRMARRFAALEDEAGDLVQDAVMIALARLLAVGRMSRPQLTELRAARRRVGPCRGRG